MTVRTRVLIVTATLALGLLPAAAQHDEQHDARALRADPRLADGPIAPKLDGLTDHHFDVSTSSDRAQQFFDQGLRLTYGFNHQEALRAFKEAARLDPKCAMAYWGWALVLGPNLNLPMRESVVAQANEAIEMAMGRREGASAKERALIEALAARYSTDPDADRGALGAAYASAMSGVFAMYPDDDVATLYAASLMNLSPWNYWTRDGHPTGQTETFVKVLEDVLEREPRHPGALHYYIHAVESVDPERGLAAADALTGLMPGIGHMLHMPSHIYMQVGRYEDSVDGNLEATESDEGYIAQCRAQGIYPLNYYPHNVHMLAWASIMQGRSKLALESARKIADGVPDDLHGNDWGLYETFLSMPLYTLVRFGMWDDVLATPKPSDATSYLQGIWHYARGMAYLHDGPKKKAKQELAALEAIVTATAADELIGFSNKPSLLRIANHLLAGEIAVKARRWDEAFGHLERAVRLQDSLLYNEPPDWFYSIRHTLGAALLDAGRPVEAEVVYWDDLRRYPENGYSLYGLWQALEAQGDEEAATAALERFHAAWAKADTTLTSSRF